MDYRAIYDFDQDMLAAKRGKLTIFDFQAQAWQDFIDQQIAPFADLPVFLGIGDHGVVTKSRADVLLQFPDWLDSPVIRAQRLSDDPSDRKLRGYYHWRQHNIDFINLDNATPSVRRGPDQVVQEGPKEDEADGNVRTVVVAMHDALPDSISAGHSMNESATGTEGSTTTWWPSRHKGEALFCPRVAYGTALRADLMKDAETQQMEPGAATHVPLDELEPMHLAFDVALTPRQREGGFGGLQISSSLEAKPVRGGLFGCCDP